MNTKQKLAAAAIILTSLASASAQDYKVVVNTDKEPMIEGPYEANWESLSNYECPEWFRDAKFGIWAHWGPQCQAEYGDWFARNMYIEGDGQYTFSKKARGPQSQFGFKDWIHEWHAENWDPDALVKLYKECGAKYFFALANHHDNLDLYDSSYQEWNSVDVGPHKDIVGGWAEACKKYDMPLGLSVHAAHAWTWYETSRGADTKGVFKGVPYDGWLTKEDGVGQWWEGLDPQELYCQDHVLSKDNREWDWDPEKVTIPDQAYCDKFYNRTMELLKKYNPDIIYYDDTVLPLYPFSDAGLKLTANTYNKSIADYGQDHIVVTGKVLPDEYKGAITWDVERGAPDKAQPLPWQTCTCIGSWHYDKNIYYDERYKSASFVICMLVDVVSKNGNLLLSVPLRGDGTPDPTELRIVKEIGAWLEQNGESIYGTRPWIKFGEGPSADGTNPVHAQGFNEHKLKYSFEDVRYVKKGEDTVYATILGIPEANATITLKSIAKAKTVELVGYGKVPFVKTADGISVTLPEKYPNDIALVLKISKPKTK